MIGFGLGFLILSSVLEVEAWYTSAFDIEEVLAGATDSHVHLFRVFRWLGPFPTHD